MIELAASATTDQHGWNLLPVLRRRWRTVVICTAVAACLAAGAWARVPVVFESQAQVLLSKHEVLLAPQTKPMQEIVQVHSSELATQAEIARSTEVISVALKEHGLEKLPSLTPPDTTTPPAEVVRAGLQVMPGARVSEVLEFRLRSRNPADGQQVLNAVLNQYGRFVQDAGAGVRQSAAEVGQAMENATSKSGAHNRVSWLNSQTITPASQGRNVSPGLALYLAMGILGGCVSGVGLACLQQVLDRSFESTVDLENWTHLPVLTRLPNLTPTATGSSQKPLAPEEESLRRLRSYLTATADSGDKVLAIASVNPGGGTSTLTANLACCVSRTGKRVLLIDCHLHAPTLHTLLGVAAQPGLTQALGQRKDPAQFIQQVPGTETWVLAAGVDGGGAADLFESQEFATFLATAREQYDMVLLDCPAVLATADAASLGSLADRMLLNVHPSHDTRPTVRWAQVLLDRCEVHLVGLVVNGCDRELPAAEEFGQLRRGRQRETNSAPTQPPRVGPPAPKSKSRFRPTVDR